MNVTMLWRALKRNINGGTVRGSYSVFSSRRRPTSCSTPGIVFRPMRPEDDEQLRSLFTYHFFTGSTMARLLDMKVPDECTMMVDRLSIASAVGWTVVAEDAESKTLVGASVAFPVDILEDNIRMPFPLNDRATEKEKIFVDFMDNNMYSLYKGKGAHDWFVRHKVDKFVRGYQGTVHTDFRQKGILKDVLWEAIRLVSDRGVRCYVGEAGNPLVKRTMANMGFEELSSLLVADYSYKGQQLFGDCSDARMTLMGKILF